MDLTLLDTAQLHKAQANAGQAVRSVKDAGRDGRAREAAEAFEAMVIAQMLAPMFATLPTDGPFGGGHAEGVYRSMMVDEIGKTIARGGGIGLADNVHAEILKLQEV